MKKFILAAAIFPLFSFAAYAADLPNTKGAPAFAPPPPPLAYDWTGVYVGGELGGAWAQNSGSFVYPPPATWSNSLSTGIGGGFIGAQYQWNPIVIGIEGDLAALFDGNTGQGTCKPAASCGAGDFLRARVDDPIWSVGARLGYAADKFMPYVTGGYAGARISQTSYFPTGAPIDSTGRTQSGFYVGGGVDYAITANLILGVEYRYYDLGKVTATPVTVGGVPIHTDTWTTSTTADSVMARLSYKFDFFAPPGPVTAKY